MRHTFSHSLQCKLLLIKYLPRSILFLMISIKNILHLPLYIHARYLWKKAVPDPASLPEELLCELDKMYPAPTDYGWDPDSYLHRGQNRCREILRHSAARSSQSFLEIGCWDGMVCRFLTENGKTTTAVDLSDAGFDPRALEAGVRMFPMDAHKLDFKDNSFDFIFSYDTFEHVAYPEIVFDEMLRVTKPGGHIYLYFAPLYCAPYGEHAWGSCHVPYIHFLYNLEQINRFALNNNRKQIDPKHVNRWTIQQYRSLFSKNRPRANIKTYYEYRDYRHLDIICRFPRQFREKTKRFEDLVVSGVEVLFQKSI